METFWGVYGGDWDATYTRWSSSLGIPEGDMNSWADSCPTQAGYDELGNYMTYNTPVCFPALGHFTRGQVGAPQRRLAARVGVWLGVWGLGVGWGWGLGWGWGWVGVRAAGAHACGAANWHLGPLSGAFCCKENVKA